MQPLETPAVLAPGEHGLAAELGGHGAVFGPDLTAGAVRVRGGMTRDLEGSVEASVAHVHDAQHVRTNPEIYGLRGGAKWQVWKHLSLGAGFGLGASAAGAFASPDLGSVIAFENPFLVPFASVRGYVSAPLGGREVVLAIDLGDDEQDPDDDMEITDKPKLTVGANVTAGVRVPLRRHGEERGSVIAGLLYTAMADEDDDEGFGGAAAGLEVLF